MRELLERHRLAEEKRDARAALICAVIANANRGKKGKRFKPQDFMPGQQREKREDWRQQLRYVEMLNVVFGGTDRRH